MVYGFEFSKYNGQGQITEIYFQTNFKTEQDAFFGLEKFVSSYCGNDSFSEGKIYEISNKKLRVMPYDIMLFK